MNYVDPRQKILIFFGSGFYSSIPLNLGISINLYLEEVLIVPGLHV